MPMSLDDLSPEQIAAIRHSLEYWISHWDWESPTLFGLSQDDFSEIVGGWPQSVFERQEDSALAVLGALREILHGASAPSDVPSIVGIGHSEASALLTQLLPRIDRVLG
jgi:hypothetical protein